MGIDELAGMMLDHLISLISSFVIVRMLGMTPTGITGRARFRGKFVDKPSAFLLNFTYIIGASILYYIMAPVMVNLFNVFSIEWKIAILAMLLYMLSK